MAETKVSVIVAALNEEASIGEVVRGMPWAEIAECIVVDNGSTDGTAAVARAAGARVVHAARGYGNAMSAGAREADAGSEILVFCDGDGADVLEQMPRLVGPIERGEADFVIGSRLRGTRERGSMLASQVFAAKLIGMLVRRLYGFRYTDMGAFRAIRRDALAQLPMSEMTFGWNLEMQVRALQAGLRVIEVPVDYRCRTAGESKVSGNLKASVVAGWRIAGVLWRVRGGRVNHR